MFSSLWKTMNGGGGMLPCRVPVLNNLVCHTVFRLVELLNWKKFNYFVHTLHCPNNYLFCLSDADRCCVGAQLPFLCLAIASTSMPDHVWVVSCSFPSTLATMLAFAMQYSSCLVQSVFALPWCLFVWYTMPLKVNELAGGSHWYRPKSFSFISQKKKEEHKT